jgi:hypothetical protein
LRSSLSADQAQCATRSDRSTSASMRAFVKPPLNPDVQWFIEVSLRYAVSMTLLCIVGRRCLLVAEPSSRISEFKVGVYRAPRPLLGLTSIRAGTRPVTTYRIRAKALGPNPCYQRTPSNRTVARKPPADVSGALTFNSLRCIAVGNKRALLTRRWL